MHSLIYVLFANKTEIWNDSMRKSEHSNINTPLFKSSYFMICTLQNVLEYYLKDIDDLPWGVACNRDEDGHQREGFMQRVQILKIVFLYLN